MKAEKILLLHLGWTGGLGETLQTVLKSSPRLNIVVRQGSISTNGTASDSSGLSEVILNFDPDVIFVILSVNLIKQAPTRLSFIRSNWPERPILIIVDGAEPENIFELIQLGMDDFITTPLKTSDILPRLWRLVGRLRPKQEVTGTLIEKMGLRHLVGQSPVFLAEVEKIPMIAQCDANILISGETGTGKELYARAIHYCSPRADSSFIALNCGAIPEDLLENELFGHKRGAFTGATHSQQGLIHAADRGTLFLDEIDCFPLTAQVKLLRFLQEKEYRALGSPTLQKTDVRIMAASNVNLEQAVREGKLRRDLYYRLNVISVFLPALRERPDDIPLLATHFLHKYVSEFRKPAMVFAPSALDRLVSYTWPGNVRELEHLVERTVLLCKQATIYSADLTFPALESKTYPESFQKAKERVITQFERTYIQSLLLIYQGNITKAARAAQKDRRAFWELLRKHRIVAQTFKRDPGVA